MLSMTTDYVKSTGEPSSYLRRIAEAGFTHIHWCHQWNTDFIYLKPEIDQIAAWLREYGLQLLDLHGSSGAEKCWGAAAEYSRQAGVLLVANRLEMAARLGGGVVIMHAQAAQKADGTPTLEPMRRSLDELEPLARKLGVRVAIENGSWPTVRDIMADYAPDYLGLCYDSGHGNNDGVGLNELEGLKERLISVHIHDNDGKSDQHRIPFTGTVDWERYCDLVAASSYNKPISLETVIRNEGEISEEEFLGRCLAAARRLTTMVDVRRK